MNASPALIDASARFGGSAAMRASAMSLLPFGRRGVIGMAANRFSLIAAFYELTGWTDAQIAALLSSPTRTMPRSTVQAFRTQKLDENLSDDQRERILEAAKQYRQQVYEAVAQMELYS